MTKFNNIIFDLDGTLIDSAHSIIFCLNMAIKHCGYHVEKVLESGLIGPPLSETLSFITGESNPEKLAELINAFKIFYDEEGYKSSVPYDGIQEVLIKLKKIGLQIYIATNKRFIPTTKIIKHLHWDGIFEDIYTIDLHKDFSEDKESVLRKMQLDYQFDKKSVCYVGDRYEDYEAASKNEFNFIFVDWGYGASNKSPVNFIHANYPNDLFNILTQSQ